MSAHAARPPRGGAPVGFLEDLPPLEAAAVLYLRLWSAGAAGQRQLLSDFRLALGHGAGIEAAGAFGEICDICARHGRRPMMLHQDDCRCLGADEACFAQLLARGAEGAREDAILLGTLLVRPDIAFVLAGLAEAAGMALRRMVVSTGRTVAADDQRAHKLH